jgi:putative ABC transport system permease protein
VRTLGDPQTITPAVRAAVRDVDRNQPVDAAAGMPETLGRMLAKPRFNMLLLGAFALLAFVLAVIGIYGLVSYSVTQRTHEIGIRMALGAADRSVIRLVLREGGILAGTGIAVGLLCASAAVRVLQSFLFGIPPYDWITFAAISFLLLGVCLVASYLPARRASKLDPLDALRHE